MDTPDYPSEAGLASYAVRSADSLGRRHPEPEHPFRTPFQRDRDRIIHSTAFRRLQYKTQVFVNHDGDHYRTRLTHTLEVMQIARTLARALTLNEDLAEAVALAHDLGHTPFGHSGEEALNAFMIDHGGFEHNAHGLRVVDELERRYPSFAGINLTYEVREGFARHSTRHEFPRAEPEFPRGIMAPIESQLVVLADEIAYDNHDLDDGLRSGILHLSDVQRLAVWRRAEEACGADLVGLPDEQACACIIRRLIDLEVLDVIETTRANIRRGRIKTLKHVRNAPAPSASFSPEIQSLKDELEEFLTTNLYRYYTVARMSAKSRRFLAEMFRAYCDTPQMLPPEFQAGIERWGLERSVCDYIAGMTDRYAQDEYLRLFQPFERT